MVPTMAERPTTIHAKEEGVGEDHKKLHLRTGDESDDDHAATERNAGCLAGCLTKSQKSPLAVAEEMELAAGSIIAIEGPPSNSLETPIASLASCNAIARGLSDARTCNGNDTKVLEKGINHLGLLLSDGKSMSKSASIEVPSDNLNDEAGYAALYVGKPTSSSTARNSDVNGDKKSSYGARKGNKSGRMLYRVYCVSPTGNGLQHTAHYFCEAFGRVCHSWEAVFHSRRVSLSSSKQDNTLGVMPPVYSFLEPALWNLQSTETCALWNLQLTETCKYGALSPSANDRDMHWAHSTLQITDACKGGAADCPYFCFALWCSPCASYLLKRALYDDMSRYVCCAGYMPCSGGCGEFYLCTELEIAIFKRLPICGATSPMPFTAPFAPACRPNKSGA